MGAPRRCKSMNGWMSGILMLWNMGIVAGLMLGGMLVLRPVLLLSLIHI